MNFSVKMLLQFLVIETLKQLSANSSLLLSDSCLLPPKFAASLNFSFQSIFYILYNLSSLYTRSITFLKLFVHVPVSDTALISLQHRLSQFF